MANCKGCGKKIIWGVTPEGKKIPLDPSPPVYAVEVGAVLHTDGQFVRRASGFHVSHFATCPNANDFSKGRKPCQGQPERE